MRCCIGLLLAAVSGWAASISGEFRLERVGEAWRILLTRHDTMVDARRVLLLERLPSGGPAQFRLVRDAGVFEFQGAPEGASGKFTFTPSEDFVQRARELVPNWWEPGLAFEAAIRGIGTPPTPVTLQLNPPPRPLRYDNDIRRQRLETHGVTPDFLRQLKQSGYDAISDNQLINMRSAGITTSDLFDLQTRGYRDLTVEQMVKIKTDGFRTPPK